LPPEGFALYLYIYIMAALVFIIELLLFEISRNVGFIMRQRKKQEEVDAEAVLWLRRIEATEYDPSRYSDEF
jgi:hypothetical protein